MRSLTQRERKIVAVGILVAGIAAAWLVVIDPVIGGFIERASERADLEDQYARNQRLLTGIPLWRAQAQEQSRTAHRYAINAATKALALNVLRSRVSGLANGDGASLAAFQPVDAGTQPGWVRARADLHLTMDQLYQGLVRLERGEPYVVVEYLSVAADKALESGHLSQMDVRIEVSAAFDAGVRR